MGRLGGPLISTSRYRALNPQQVVRMKNPRHCADHLCGFPHLIAKIGFPAPHVAEVQRLLHCSNRHDLWSWYDTASDAVGLASVGWWTGAVRCSSTVAASPSGRGDMHPALVLRRAQQPRRYFSVNISRGAQFSTNISSSFGRTPLSQRGNGVQSSPADLTAVLNRASPSPSGRRRWRRMGGRGRSMDLRRRRNVGCRRG